MIAGIADEGIGSAGTLRRRDQSSFEPICRIGHVKRGVYDN